jgi:hypothetical protein
MIHGAAWHPARQVDGSGWLRTDFLLVTVVPRNKEGGYAITVGGGSGPGTGAFEMLLDAGTFPLSALESLVGDLEGAAAYQVVFEVEVEHSGRFSMPKSIALSKECPPVRIDLAGALTL